MRRASGQRWPKRRGKLSRIDSRTRPRISSADQGAWPMATRVALSAASMLRQLSTRVLSQSKRMARGRASRAARPSAATGVSLTAPASRGRPLAGRVIEIDLAQLEGEGARLAVADHAVVDLADRHDMGGGAGEKGLAGRLRLLEAEGALLEGEPALPGELEHRLA